MSIINTKKFDRNHRAVAPVIATILLVAIAVVGGTLIFSFSGEFFSEQQLTSSGGADILIFNGYDARDTTNRVSHTGFPFSGTTDPVSETVSQTGDGFGSVWGSASIGDGIFSPGDRIFVYVQNIGTTTLDIVTVKFLSSVYTFNNTGNVITSIGNDNSTIPFAGGYAISTVGTKTLSSDQILQAGEEATIVISLSESTKIGRQGLIVVETGNGEFAESIKIGRRG